MIDKYLRKLCAQEVQIMIAKLESDYGEFTQYSSVWMRLVEQQRYLTAVEKFCVRRAKRRAERDYDRQQYLAAILRQQLTPVTLEQMEDAAPISKIQRAQMAAYQRAMMNSNMANQMMNAATQQSSPFQQGLYK